MASAPAPDLIDKQEAFAAIARAAAERVVVGQNGPVEPFDRPGPYWNLHLGAEPPGGLVGTAATPRQHNALLPNGSVRLDGQEYKWATLSDGTGAWIVVVGE